MAGFVIRAVAGGFWGQDGGDVAGGFWWQDGEGTVVRGWGRLCSIGFNFGWRWLGRVGCSGCGRRF